MTCGQSATVRGFVYEKASAEPVPFQKVKIITVNKTIYGAVTNAYEWVFLKLEGNTVFVDKKRYYLNELPKLLGVLQFITNQYV